MLHGYRAVIALVEALIEYRTLDGAEIDEIIQIAKFNATSVFRQRCGKPGSNARLWVDRITKSFLNCRMPNYQLHVERRWEPYQK